MCQMGTLFFYYDGSIMCAASASVNKTGKVIYLEWDCQKSKQNKTAQWHFLFDE